MFFIARSSLRFSASIFASLLGSERVVGVRLPPPGIAPPRAIPTVSVELAVPAELVPDAGPLLKPVLVEFVPSRVLKKASP